ncbi:DUF2130 domain-containing protein [Brucella pseudogrignonensis]|uniref:DUF2130 domain-containing protein n=1 Tax=Brucella pseudogrignonensis TaxID=419475 RepID=UPI002E26B32A
MSDMKAKLSTKMIGETLEQHCATEFDRIRATAFPRAYFEKNNDARNGSKGDLSFVTWTMQVLKLFDHVRDEERERGHGHKEEE